MLGGKPAQGGVPPPHIFPDNTENKYSTQKMDPWRQGTAPNISNYFQLRMKLETTILKLMLKAASHPRTEMSNQHIVFREQGRVRQRLITFIGFTDKDKY